MVTYIGHVLDYTRKEAGPIINTKICIAIHNYRRYTSGYTRIYISKSTMISLGKSSSWVAVLSTGIIIIAVLRRGVGL